MRALVTGACGFVGPHLVRHLHSMGDEVAGTYRNARNAKPANSYVLDLYDRNAVGAMVREFKPDVVYHLAGMSFVPEANSNFPKALELNVGVTEVLLSVCTEEAPAVKLVYVSSGEVYGRVADTLPFVETMPVDPANYYSLTKAMAEMLVWNYRHKLSSVIARPFNHIGPGQDVRFVTSTFANQLAQIAHGLQEPVIRVGNLDAERDFTDVSDVVRGYRLAALKGRGVYNFCSSTPVAIKRILHELIAAAQIKVTIQQDLERMRPSENPVVYGSFDRALQDLEWKPLVSLKESLKGVYDYWYEEVGRLKANQ
jgi:GDP-4-dehydro-6-deoxy-D-mannose reductase